MLERLLIKFLPELSVENEAAPDHFLSLDDLVAWIITKYSFNQNDKSLPQLFKLKKAYQCLIQNSEGKPALPSVALPTKNTFQFLTPNLTSINESIAENKQRLFFAFSLELISQKIEELEYESADKNIRQKTEKIAHNSLDELLKLRRLKYDQKLQALAELRLQLCLNR